MMPSKERDAVLERREMILERARQPAWKIAFDLGLSARTVQRHRDQARAGLPIGKRPSSAAIERARIVGPLRAGGASGREVARQLGITRDAVRRAEALYQRLGPDGPGEEGK